MKKFLALSLLLCSMVFAVPSGAEAKTTNENAKNAVELNAAQQNRYYQSRRTSRIYTRLVRSGRRVYRETYRVTYFRNGRTQTRLISRVRVR